MAFVVEDNTGLEDANAYIDVAFLDSYASQVGYDLTGKSETDKENAIVRTTLQYIDVEYEFKGSPLNADQALQLPTSEVLINDKIRRAVADACIAEMKGELFITYNPIGNVKSQKDKLDVLESEIVYQDNPSTYQASFGKTPTTDKLLKPYLASSGGLFQRWPL